MTVNHGLSTFAQNIESTSPWNFSGREVTFAEIPAFNHSDITMQRKIPDLISKWIAKTWYVVYIISFKNHDANVCSGTERPIDSGILYLHSMASQRINEDFKKHLEPFVTLCHACRHRPTSVLLVSTMWPHDESEADINAKARELEDHFQKASLSAIHSIPYSIRFDESQTSAHNAIELLILDIQQVIRTASGTARSFSSPPQVHLTLSDSSMW